MTSYDFALGKPGYVLRLTVTEDTLNAVANTSRAVGSLSIIKGTGTGRFTSYTASWSINIGGNTSSGSIPGYDFSGYSVLTLWSGAFTITHTADGSKSISVAGSFSESDPFPELGNGTASGTFPLTTLRLAPGTPTGVAATYVSDTSVSLVWTNNSASNGAPTSNSIQASVNGGAFGALMTIGASGSVSASTAANRKTIYKVNASNSTGTSAWSSSSAPSYTTPDAPSGVVAAKSGSDIVVDWVNNVGFTEYQTVVWHGTMVGATITWDASALATVATGGTSYTHTAPNTAQIHVYRVQAKNLATGTLTSSFVQSNSVQLLTAPNAPTFGAVPSYANKAVALVVPWTHNPVDTTGQTAYEFGYSTNGGTSWSSTGKVTSGTSSYTIAASTYAANAAVTVRVRTWGAATSGGSDGTGASPWSTMKTVTFKTRPVATITTPATGVTFTQATLTVVLGFTQAESATSVQATIDLYEGATLVESTVTTTIGGTTLGTRVADGGTYTVKATVTDSNGLTSAEVTSTFDVDYTEPVAAGVTVTYLPDSGIAQLDLTIASPGAGEVAAVAVTISRTIDGATETIVDSYAATSSMTFLDMTPTIFGTNLYTVTTFSVDGASVETVEELVTAEPYWAFLNTGAGFTVIINFFGNLKVAAAPVRSATLVATSGRSRPIALFGQSGSLQVSGSADILPDEGSTVQEIEAFILTAGTVCYRDPSGRRVFGALTGSLDSPSSLISAFTFTVTETS